MEKEKHPNEKPDLIKGSYGPLKKHLSITTMKGDSIVLSENQARYKVSMDNNMFMYMYVFYVPYFFVECRLMSRPHKNLILFQFGETP